MSDAAKLLAVRKAIKARKPTFVRQDAHKKNEIKRTGWRRPRGIHSKMREGRRGYRRKISIGWKSPAQVRGMDRTGLQPVLIYRVSDLERLTSTTQGGIIASRVGGRKRLAILGAAQGKYRILNVKDIAAAIKKLTEAKALAKQAALAKASRKEAVAKKAPAKPEKKADEQPKTKEEEKKEHDKLLTQREV